MLPTARSQNEVETWPSSTKRPVWDLEGRLYGTRQTRYLDAFVVALSQACKGGRKRWYASTLELKLTSLDMCRACRSISILDVRVSSQTPGSFWFPRITQTRPSTRSSKLGVSSRVPVVRALRLTWTLSTETLLRTAATELWMSSECLWLDGPLGAASLGSAVWWPRGLTQLVLYTDLDIPIENVLWPVRLQCLELRGRFNQPITGAVWPAFLRKVSFGMRFNQPIAGVVWPASVQQLSFLYMFNHPIAG
ncbi:unnamed protein product, partial [Ectocarpus fasciculatus]